MLELQHPDPLLFPLGSHKWDEVAPKEEVKRGQVMPPPVSNPVIVKCCIQIILHGMHKMMGGHHCVGITCDLLTFPATVPMPILAWRRHFWSYVAYPKVVLFDPLQLLKVFKKYSVTSCIVDPYIYADINKYWLSSPIRQTICLLQFSKEEKSTQLFMLL
jgi:hypothetical protein